MIISSNLKSALEKKGYTILRSESRKVFEEFNGSAASRSLWEYLRLHPSIRVIFNALIKSGTINLNAALLKLPDLLQDAQTSFIYVAHCKNKKCENILDRKNVLDFNGNVFKNNITCPNCKTKNNLERKDYRPDFNPDIDDLIRVLLMGIKYKVFSLTYIRRCYQCDTFSYLDEGAHFTAKCPKCKQHRTLSSEFAPADEVLEKITKEQQGHWLEWYVWKILHENKHDSSVGIKLQKNKTTFECDLILLINGKLICVECKDSNDESFISKLHNRKNLIDYYVLVTSNKTKPDVVHTINQIFPKKFLHIASKDIEHLATLLKSIKIVKAVRERND